MQIKPNPDFIIFDFETLSPNAVDCMVVSMGAICGMWSDELNDLRMSGFYRVVDYTSQKKYDRKIDPTTVEWWKRQSSEAQKVITETSRVPIEQVLTEFTEWCDSKGVDRFTPIWVRAPHYDFIILDNLYKQIAPTERQPLLHWNVRDTRTACDILYKTRTGFAPNKEVVFEQEGITVHNALDDCLKEFLQLRPYFIGLNKS